MAAGALTASAQGLLPTSGRDSMGVRLSSDMEIAEFPGEGLSDQGVIRWLRLLSLESQRLF